MNKALFYNDFLHLIEELYSRVTSIILENRIAAYHHDYNTDNSTGHILDIKAPLFTYIDDLSSKKRQPDPDVQTLDYSYFSEPTHSPSPSHSELASQRVLSKKTYAKHSQTGLPPGFAGSTNQSPIDPSYVNGLSKYFKAIHNFSELHPGVAQILTQSVWDHLHSSIRHARLGNARVAKMHADFSNNAFKELAHYETDEVHSNLALELEDELNALFKQKSH